MQTIEVKDWQMFEQRLRELCGTEVSGKTPEFLFRGVGDSTWELTTTLERAGEEGVGISDYYGLISRLKPQIESFTGSAWEIASYPDVKRLLQDYDTWADHRFPKPSEYSYMVHLRHHGLPSPLLDWSRSPYVAAFFAFRSAVKPREGKVSIYAFSEMPKGFKVTGSGKSWIRRMGPYVTTHRRHFLQQCDYTICAAFKEIGDQPGEWHFAKHEGVFQRGEPHQDFLWKFSIPYTERLKVLDLLDTYNLNAFSLFESDESLMETLAIREMQFTAKARAASAPQENQATTTAGEG
jgi:hypothetical protein